MKQEVRIHRVCTSLRFTTLRQPLPRIEVDTISDVSITAASSWKTGTIAGLVTEDWSVTSATETAGAIGITRSLSQNKETADLFLDNIGPFLNILHFPVSVSVVLAKSSLQVFAHETSWFDPVSPRSEVGAIHSHEVRIMKLFYLFHSSSAYIRLTCFSSSLNWTGPSLFTLSISLYQHPVPRNGILMWFGPPVPVHLSLPLHTLRISSEQYFNVQNWPQSSSGLR